MPTPLPTSRTPFSSFRIKTIWILAGLFLLLVSTKAGLVFALSILPPRTGVSATRHSPSLPSCYEGDLRTGNSLHGAANNINDGEEKQTSDSSAFESRQRRNVLKQLTGVAATTLIAVPSIANAGEVGARITKAVTTSDLGISVRTSVVKGAQLADKIDGQWEKLSDKYGLGSERTKQIGRRPKDKIIPEPLPLNIDTAQKVLEVSDEIFLKLMPSMSGQTLASRVEKIARSAMPSFIRSGVVFSVDKDASGNINFEKVPTVDLLRFETAPQFNFIVYAHFKAYSELILERGNNINFSKFRTEYERGVGQRLIETLQLENTAATMHQTDTGLKDQLLAALDQTDTLGRRLRELGLVANVDRNSIESTDDLQDFVDDALADLIITISVDGDVTLQSQMLLQEQGYRLYPNFNRFIVTEFFRDAVQTKAMAASSALPRNDSANGDSNYKVSVIDYYFDTNYNSDPDKFEVKQVLLNVSIE